MTGKRKDVEEGDNSFRFFFAKSIEFFSSVLKRLPPYLSFVWGVEVLLFIILLLMILFGSITVDQRFALAILITVCVVFTFAFTVWKLQPGGPDGEPPESELVEQAKKCLDLLTQMRNANARIIRRGRSGSGPWAEMLTDTYGRVCDTCHRRRLGTEPPDGYFDSICPESDVKTVCDRKWELGEAIDGYRSRLSRISSLPREHDELELMIRRSVIQPDWSPTELDTVVGQAIEGAKRLVG